MSRLFSIDPVGNLECLNTNVRTKSARMTAMTIDSKYSRTGDFLNSAMRCGLRSRPTEARA